MFYREAGNKDAPTIVLLHGFPSSSHMFRDLIPKLSDRLHVRADIDASALTAVEHQTFCPYKGVCSYYDIGDARLAAWSYREAYPGVDRISNLVSFEQDIVSVQLDGSQLYLEPGQTVFPHRPDRDLEVHAGTDKQA
jgi:hypothetical protein